MESNAAEREMLKGFEVSDGPWDPNLLFCTICALAEGAWSTMTPEGCCQAIAGISFRKLQDRFRAGRSRLAMMMGLALVTDCFVSRLRVKILASDPCPSRGGAGIGGNAFNTLLDCLRKLWGNRA